MYLLKAEMEADGSGCGAGLAWYPGSTAWCEGRRSEKDDEVSKEILLQARPPMQEDWDVGGRGTSYPDDSLPSEWVTSALYS